MWQPLTMTMQANVVTYQTPRGDSVNIMPAAEAVFREAGVWPRGFAGEQYASVSHGLHYASVDIDEDLAHKMVADDTMYWPDVRARINAAIED